VLQGKRYIYYGDVRQEICQGSVYYLRAGTHQIEDIPKSGKPFEQIVFYYDNFQINRILNHLNLNYEMQIPQDHECPNCRNRSEVSYPAWSVLKNFFESVHHYHAENVFGQDKAAENIKMTELVYLLLSEEKCCLKRSILNNIDVSLASFEQIIYDNIFRDVTIEELAQQCTR
ncbi:MAG: AraC family transcriptional regulator, partial [Rikenellaceae bacterium]|nr:AraC family transcriptional regulator [Rikenellaceae bacterium]